MAENQENVTEQQYLELADNFKEQMDNKNFELEKLQRDHELLSKNFISLYGMLRMMDFLIQNGEIEMELAVLVEVARGFASDVVDDL
jgi:hypothetical protein